MHIKSSRVLVEDATDQDFGSGSVVVELLDPDPNFNYGSGSTLT